MQFRSRQFNRHSKAFIASLLACLVLLLDAMAIAPSLHEIFHHDSQKAEHHCAVTMFAQGQVDSASIDVQPSVALGKFEVSVSPVVVTHAPAIENLPAGRAPPVSSSNS